MDPLATQVAQRFVREAGFVPDKFWRESKAELRKLLLEELHDKRPGHVSYMLLDRLLPFFKRFHERLLGFGMHRFAEQSLKDRVEGIQKQIEEFAESYGLYDRASYGVYPITTVVDEVISSLTSRMAVFFEEKVKNLRDALKGKWTSDARAVKAIAERLVKKAPPEVLEALEASIGVDFPPDYQSRIKWGWFNSIGLDRLARKLITIDTKRSKLDPLKWIDFLQEVVGDVYTKPEAFTEFDLNGVKVVIDDSTVDERDIQRYIHYFDEAHQKLKAKGLDKVWYGTFFVRCNSCGGVNPNTGGGTGGDYPIGPDVVNVYSRPSDFIVELIAHELGHRYWFKQMSKGQRGRFESFVRAHKRKPPLPGPHDPKPISHEKALEVWNSLKESRELLLEALGEFSAAEPEKAPQLARELGAAVKQFRVDFLNTPNRLGVFGKYPPAAKKLYERMEGLVREVLLHTNDFAHVADPSRDHVFSALIWNKVQEASAEAQKFIDVLVDERNDEIKQKTDEARAEFKKEWEEDPRQVLPVSEYGKSNIDEAFAEVFAWYVLGKELNRDQLESFKSVLKSASLAERVADRFLAAKVEPLLHLEEAIKVFEATGELKPLQTVLTTIFQRLSPGGKFPSWYQTLVPQKRKLYRIVTDATQSALRAIANVEKGIPLVDKFRTSLPLYAKELEKLGPVLEATQESAVLTHGPWKVHNVAGLDEKTLAEVFALLDHAGSHLHDKFRKVLYGAIYLGNTVGGFGALANYLPGNDTVQINMKAFGNERLPDMVKTLIHELGHRYWYRFMKKTQWTVFKKLSTEPGYVESQIHYDHALKSRIADEYLEFVRTPKTKRKQKTWSPELVGWLRDMHAEGKFLALDKLTETDPKAEDKIRAMIMAPPDKVVTVQGEKYRDGISVSDYGATKVYENFAEGFAYYALKREMHPDMVHFFDNL